MSDPTFSAPTLTGYNSSPPSDDGSQVAANLVSWSTIKTKLTDPLSTYAQAISTATAASVGAINQLFSTVTTQSANFAPTSANDATLYLCSGNTTVTLPTAASMGSGGRLGFKKTDSAATTLTFTPNGAETIDGLTTLAVIERYALVILVSDGSNWHMAQATGFRDGTVALPGITFFGDSDTGFYRIGANNVGVAMAGAKVMEFTAAGSVIKPLQPAFCANNSTQDTNQTGDGTSVSVQFDAERFDQQGNFATPSFTAPVDGKYAFSASVSLGSLGAGHTSAVLQLVTSNKTYTLCRGNAAAMRDSGNSYNLNGSMTVEMEAADTASIAVVVSNSTKTVSIDNNSDTFFSGALAA